MVRDLLGRSRGDEGEGTEAGFTLIELMVVLLIMAILLAIAIPTFLSVTNGAKKTATQSDLTNSVETATALFTKTTTFPTTETTFLTDLHKTQTTISYQTTTGTLATQKGKNVLDARVFTSNEVIMAGEDGATWCWAVSDNQSSTPVTIGGWHMTPGDTFTGYEATSTDPCNLGNTGLLSLSRTWRPNFKTLSGT